MKERLRRSISANANAIAIAIAILRPSSCLVVGLVLVFLVMLPAILLYILPNQHYHHIPLQEQTDSDRDSAKDYSNNSTQPSRGYLGGIDVPESMCGPRAQGVLDVYSVACGQATIGAMLSVDALFPTRQPQHVIQSTITCRYFYSNTSIHSSSQQQQQDGYENRNYTWVWDPPGEVCRPEIITFSTICMPLLDVYVQTAARSGVGFKVLKGTWGGWGNR